MKVWSWRHAIQQSKVSSTTKHVLLNLSIYMNDRGEGCFPSISRQAEDTGLSERAVYNALKSAEEAGLIKRRKFIRDGIERNEYMADLPDENAKNVTENSAVSTHAPNAPLHHMHPTPAPNAGVPLHHMHPPIYKDELSNNNSPINSPIKKLTKKFSTGQPEGFENFWNEYGKIGNKQQALKAWKKITGTNYAAIMAGLKRYQEQCKALGTEQQFIKHASTWLNAKGWEDEYPIYPTTGRKPSVHETTTLGIQLFLSQHDEQSSY